MKHFALSLQRKINKTYRHTVIHTLQVYMYVVAYSVGTEYGQMHVDAEYLLKTYSSIY